MSNAASGMHRRSNAGGTFTAGCQALEPKRGEVSRFAVWGGSLNLHQQVESL